jgi:hypothetical protein
MMNISVYRTGSMSDWYPTLLHKILLELGHNSNLIGRGSETIIDDDITFFVIFANSLEYELKQIKGKTKCVALIETEQILHAASYHDRFDKNQILSDVIVFPYQFFYDAPKYGNFIRKPTFNMPLGYHETLCHTAVPMPHRNILMLESYTTLRKPYLDAIGKSGYSIYNDRTFDLQDIANRVASVDICLTIHAYGSGSFLSGFKVVALFVHNLGLVMSQRASDPLFEEDKHIVYFEGTNEMLEKCKYYIEHPEEGRKIAIEAHNRLKTIQMSKIVESTISAICKMGGA